MERSDLIPGLPQEIATECMMRVPFSHHSTMKFVCKEWNSQLSDPSFYRRRKADRQSEQFVLCSALDISWRKTRINLRLYAVRDDLWHKISAPDVTESISDVVALFASGKLIILQEILSSLYDVHVYVRDLIRGGSWRRAAPMLATRHMFATGVAPSGAIFVAGGTVLKRSRSKQIRLAEMYDPDTDKWTQLPPMSHEMESCTGFADSGGRFWVSGYLTQTGVAKVQCYDPRVGRWISYANDRCPCVLTPTDSINVCQNNHRSEYRCGCSCSCYCNRALLCLRHTPFRCHFAAPLWEMDNSTGLHLAGMFSMEYSVDEEIFGRPCILRFGEGVKIEHFKPTSALLHDPCGEGFSFWL